MPQIGLKKWDRLLPTKALPDVAQFEHKSPPFEATFWRMDKHSRVVHDCPILEHPMITGFSYDDWVIDVLHGWVLGPVSGLVGKSFQFCVKSGIFTPTSVYLDSSDRDRLAMLHIKTLLSVHYEHKRKTDPNSKLHVTQVGIGFPGRLKTTSF